MGARDIHDFIAGFDDASRAQHNVLTGGRQNSPLALAFNEGDAKILLQLFQLGGQRGLADKTTFRRLAEMACVGHRHEITKILEFDIGQVDAYRYMESIERITSIDMKVE